MPAVDRGVRGRFGGLLGGRRCRTLVITFSLSRARPAGRAGVCFSAPSFGLGNLGDKLHVQVCRSGNRVALGAPVRRGRGLRAGSSLALSRTGALIRTRLVGTAKGMTSGLGKLNVTPKSLIVVKRLSAVHCSFPNSGNAFFLSGDFCRSRVSCRLRFRSRSLRRKTLVFRGFLGLRNVGIQGTGRGVRHVLTCPGSAARR